MKTPEAVVFDLGKVLVDFDYSIAAKKLAARCSNGHCDLPAIINSASPLLFRYETGAMTTEQFFTEVRRLSQFSGELDEFSKIFADIFSPIEPMIAAHEVLRQRGIPTYIFSNTNPLAVNHIREKFPFFRNFTKYVLSYEHGSMKPDQKIYEVVEQITGKSGSEIVYIDDRPENIETGSTRGWHSILHDNPAITLQKMTALGLY
jgi:HAD superfamily hydrolase (TIGR01509 family)